MRTSNPNDQSLGKVPLNVPPPPGCPRIPRLPGCRDPGYPDNRRTVIPGGCTIKHEVETPKPVNVNLNIAPITATVDVNVNVRIQREVNDIYDSIYGPSSSPAATTQPMGT